MQQCRAGGQEWAWKRTRCCLGLLLAWMVSDLVWADSAVQLDDPRLLRLELPAQNLAPALEAFSRATGMAVLVDRELTRGRRSIGVHGRYSPQQALSLLLTGSGLMARYARSDAFTLQEPQVSPPVANQGLTARGVARVNRSYAMALQQAIESSLCRSPLTRPGSFRALVQVWINHNGLIEHSRLVTSTGDPQRDEALVRSLATTRVDRPAPSSLRSPFTLLLMPDTTGKRMDCTVREGALGA